MGTYYVSTLHRTTGTERGNVYRKLNLETSRAEKIFSLERMIDLFETKLVSKLGETIPATNVSSSLVKYLEVLAPFNKHGANAVNKATELLAQELMKRFEKSNDTLERKLIQEKTAALTEARELALGGWTVKNLKSEVVGQVAEMGKDIYDCGRLAFKGLKAAAGIVTTFVSVPREVRALNKMLTEHAEPVAEQDTVDQLRTLAGSYEDQVSDTLATKVAKVFAKGDNLPFTPDVTKFDPEMGD